MLVTLGSREAHLARQDATSTKRVPLLDGEPCHCTCHELELEQCPCFHVVGKPGRRSGDLHSDPFILLLKSPRMYR
jgi:hypothetical protein